MSPLSSAFCPVRRTMLFVLLLSGVCSCFRDYDVVEVQETWNNAQTYCRKNYDDLAAVRDMDDLKRLMDAVGSRRGTFWIGLSDKPKNWTWSLQKKGFYDNEDIKFRVWNKGNLNNNGKRRICVASKDGVWADFECSQSLTFVCQQASNDGPFIHVKQTMTWNAAQQHCREHYIDLASVRNEKENMELQQAIGGLVWAWIGLSREPWGWSNLKAWRFRYWAQALLGPWRGNCASSMFDPGYNGTWVANKCTLRFYFICHREKQLMFKIKMRATTSTVNMSNPTVTEAIVKLIEKELKEKGINKGVKIGWTKGPDGKTFHKKP